MTSAFRRGGVRRVVFGVLLLLLVAGYLSLTLELSRSRVQRQIDLTGHPFVISDLYPRWAGVKAMLAGRDPYGEAVTAELQRVYYGRTMTRAEEREQLGTIVEFFYPPYVVVTLLPLLWLPFETVRWLATALLALCVAGSALLWWRLSGGSRRPAVLAAVAAAALLFYPSIDLITLQQLTGLVLLELVAAFSLAAHRHYALAGALLALATIKPQNAVLPAGALLFWSLWRAERRPLPLAFAGVMVAQLVLSQMLVPGWIGEFIAAGERYQAFNRIGLWLPGFLLGGTIRGAVLVAAPLALLLAWLWWRCRRESLSAPATLLTAAATMGAVVILLPDISFYNKTFLLPPLLSLAAVRLPPTSLVAIIRPIVSVWVVLPALVMALAGWLWWYFLANGGAAGAVVLNRIVALFQVGHVLLPVVVVAATIAMTMQIRSPWTSPSTSG